MIMESVQKGYRLPQPKSMPDQTYTSVVLPCWAIDPDHLPVGKDVPFNSANLYQPRITFAQLNDTIVTICADYTNVGGGAMPTLPTSVEQRPDFVQSYSQTPVNAISRAGTNSDAQVFVTASPGNGNPDLEIVGPTPYASCRGDSDDFTGRSDMDETVGSAQIPSLRNYALSRSLAPETVHEDRSNVSDTGINFAAPYSQSRMIAGITFPNPAVEPYANVGIRTNEAIEHTV
jgi:hypothetical protein